MATYIKQWNNVEKTAYTLIYKTDEAESPIPDYDPQYIQFMLNNPEFVITERDFTPPAEPYENISYRYFKFGAQIIKRYQSGYEQIIGESNTDYQAFITQNPTFTIPELPSFSPTIQRIKRWDDEAKTAYSIVEVYPNGYEQAISEQQDIYTQFLIDNPDFTVEERGYTAPPPPPDPYEGMSIDQRIARKVAERLVAAGYSQELMAAVLWNKLAGRNVEEFDYMELARMQIIAQVYSEEGIEMPS